MHESLLAKRVLAAVLDRAQRAAARQVRYVRGWIAETEALSALSLELHFHGFAKGTVAEGAKLDLRLVHVEARCLGCGVQYACQHHVLLCPGCGSARGELLGETGLGIEVMEVE
jgi:hydrogenase nickel incorporation protein HypA/HybF